jgi:hypothetical protein
MPEKKPFHESIVDAINSATQSQMGCLGALIRETKIPQNHDAIIAAWKARVAVHGYGQNYMNVLDSLLEQQKAQAKSAPA